VSEPVRAQLDLSILCTALGFFAVIIKEDALSDGSTERALHIARLAEEFCSLHTTGPAEADIVPVRPHDPDRFALHQHMAVAIISIIKESGSCVPRDLEAKGYTLEEIARCWPLARALAQVMLNMMDA